MDVHGFLADLRTRLRRVLLLDGLATLVVLLVSGLVIAVALDYFGKVPSFVRLGMLVVLLVVVVMAVVRRLVRPLARTMDDRTLAGLAERRMPGLDGRLLTQVDGIELGEAEKGILHAQLGGDAVLSLVPAATLPRRLVIALMMLIGMTLVVLLWPQAQNGLSRFLFPFGAAEWKRSSTIDGEMDAAVIAEDQPAVARLRRTEGLPAPMQLTWSAAATPSVRESRMLSGMVGPWSQALNLTPGSYTVKAESGDALPVELKVLVVRRPQLAQVTATLTPPSYTRLPPVELQTLGLTALPGSTLRYTIGFNLDQGRVVKDASLSLDGTVLSSERNDKGLTGTLAIRKGGALTIAVHDQDGIGPVPEPRFTLTLGEDRKPLVALTGPKAKETVSVRARVRVKVEASDDYGLATLALRARTMGDVPVGAERPASETKPVKEQLTPFTELNGQAATTRPAMVVVADLAKEGEHIVLVGLATDTNDVTGPGSSESQSIELKVVSETELRQEIDRLLGEARDRVIQARDELKSGMAKPEKLSLASRSAAMSSTRAGEILTQVVRRWEENELPPEQGTPIAKADGLVNVNALTALAQAVRGEIPSARIADGHLEEAEKILTGLLQDGDMTRILATLIENQRSLGEETKAFVRENLTKPLDAAGKTRQANLAQRQKELADKVKEVERRILSSPAPQLEAARELVRSTTPADQLQQAGKEVGSEKDRPQAVPRQETALKDMEKILAELRGNDAAKDLAKRAGELAARQEKIVQQLESGEEPKAVEKDQEQLKKETEQFQKQLDKQPEAQKKVGAATQAQAAAAKAMAKSDRSSATSEASAAAELLRGAQEELEPTPPKPPEEAKDQKSPDVMKLLKELRKQQLAVITDSTPIHQRIGDKAVDFAANRELPALAERESDILLRLREEGLKELGQMPIAKVAIERVAVAMERTAGHLATPALGERGMRLEKIALHELSRLIEIVESMPDPEEKEKGGPPPDGKPGKQPPFPPAAQLALLAAAQDELSVLTAANRPADLALMQKELNDLVGVVMQASRPGTRAGLLLGRASRAMVSAADLLHEKDRGATTRHEQAAAVASLRRLIAEAKGQEGKSNPSAQPQNKPSNKGSPPPGPPGSTPGDGKGAGQAAKGSEKSTGTSTGVLVGGGEEATLMHLPPERREQLQEARKQNLPPAALSIFERYLEVLGGER
jgi:hypothetical protein